MSSAALNIFYGAEPFLMAVALFALWRSKERRRFPALFVYFVLRLSSYIVLQCLLHMRAFTHVSKTTAYAWYFCVYWSTYIVGAVVVFFVLHELFKCAMEPLPGLKRLGSIAFRWVTCVSIIAALAAMMMPGASGYKLLIVACDQVMRCESIFVLCLLFFLMVAAGKLGLSYRSRIFGVSFGFGIMAAGNLVTSALLLNFDRNMWTSTISVLDTGASLVTLIVWSTFFLQKEPARHSIALPATSPLVRWNDIATALGHTSSRTAIAAPSTPAADFFLQDVEKVVDRILAKNSLNAAS